VIRDTQLPWLKEFLLARVETMVDRENAQEIIDSFRALWVIARAGARYRDRRTNESLIEFCQTLEQINPPKGDPMIRHIGEDIKQILLVILACAAALQASEIQWTRLKGTVKAANSKTQMLTIADPQGDLLSLHIDGDIDVMAGKDAVGKLSDLKLGDKVTLLYNPKAPAPKDAEEPPAGSVYQPLKR